MFPESTTTEGSSTTQTPGFRPQTLQPSTATVPYCVLWFCPAPEPSSSPDTAEPRPISSPAWRDSRTQPRTPAALRSERFETPSSPEPAGRAAPTGPPGAGRVESEGWTWAPWLCRNGCSIRTETCRRGRRGWGGRMAPGWSKSKESDRPPPRPAAWRPPLHSNSSSPPWWWWWTHTKNIWKKQYGEETWSTFISNNPNYFYGTV